MASFNQTRIRLTMELNKKCISALQHSHIEISTLEKLSDKGHHEQNLPPYHVHNFLTTGRLRTV